MRVKCKDYLSEFASAHIPTDTLAKTLRTALARSIGVTTIKVMSIVVSEHASITLKTDSSLKIDAVVKKGCGIQAELSQATAAVSRAVSADTVNLRLMAVIAASKALLSAASQQTAVNSAQA